MSLRVLLVDDHEVVRLGLKTLLSDVEWIDVVAEAKDAVTAVQAAAHYQPDAIVMDIRMPGESGIEACATITRRWPNIKVIMLTSHGEDDLLFRAIQAGASGYVLKQVGNEPVINALDAVRRGEALLDPVITQRVLTYVRQSERDHQTAAFKDLSVREMEVLALVTKGKSNGEIAKELLLAEKTVRNHVSTILSKLHLSNRIEAATYAVRHHIDDYLKS
ncbi:Two-component transcriptional response regulator, LuxR family [hydrothermal vent metagenome]|uniref:Two-component transcriptional response regulator, LuxR family n=1 Tax=hydrothermal vent metagenome TaxID=652676 RepID=A0A3B0V267_9ZZZZ